MPSFTEPSFDPEELRITTTPLVLPLGSGTRRRGRGRKCQRVGDTCACAQRSRASKLETARLGVCIYPACSGHVSTGLCERRLPKERL